MKICFLHTGFSLHGGIERVLSILIRKLSEIDDIDLCCLSLNESEPLDFYQLPSKLKRDYLFDKPINMKGALVKGGVFKLVKFLKDNKIDIIVSCGVIYYPLACIGGKLAGIKVVSWEHTNPACTNNFLFEGTSRRFGARFSDMNVLISNAAKTYYETHFRKKRNLVIYNPADDALFEKEVSYQSDSHKLISVGRLTYQKNYQLLIEIAEKVLDKHSDWSWHIYGDGEQREELENLIAEKGLTDKVVLMGNVADLYDRYSQYAGIVMTSRYEGFPMVLIEASAKGLPMISFDVSTGPKEIIDDYVNGFLIPKDDVEGMIEKLDIFISNREIRTKFSEEASKKVFPFCIDNVAAQWSKLFSDLVEHNI